MSIDLESLSVSELKKILQAANVSAAGCIDKARGFLTLCMFIVPAITLLWGHHIKPGTT